MNSYHDKEARLLSILENSGLGQEEWLISLRLVLSKSLSFFSKNRKELLANCERRDYAANDSIDDETFMSSDYSSVFNLQTNEIDWSAQNLHMCAFVAYFFLHCLRKVEYFGTAENQTNKELNEDEIFMVEILMQLMNVSSTNTSETGIFNVGGVSSSLMEGEIKAIGGSIQPAIALLNHSCDPNTIRTIHNGSFILLASRDIQEDEEVFNNYYVNFAEMETEERRKYLSRKYCFQCDCLACLENWPTKEQMPKNLDDLRPGQLLIDLGNQMGLMQQVTKIQKLGSCISQEQKAGNYQKAFGFCIQFIRVLEKTIERPHAYYLMAEKSLFKLAWILHGSMSH